jgi:hypothetical protein
MMMIVKQSMEILGIELEVLGENLRARTRAVRVGSRLLTAWVTARHGTARPTLRQITADFVTFMRVHTEDAAARNDS